ncbi:hypothetical protein Celaphus_00000591 [Cervus elaphus hippelaphus]|uniref:SPATA31 domain-containing protein n=1 Tax=Cervus elaphus hippelaphus TaxID=46360 RepID=A0A212DAJ0_CEREH|nr:hypothetical protein Celaphus_00000591 [Cervus elaphus hippelaphus]
MGTVQGHGLQVLTPAWPAQPTWPRGSWLQLVLHVFCRLLRRLPDKGGFHRVSSQDAPGDVCKAGPAGAHQPTAVTVPGSALELCHVLFNELSKAEKFQIQSKVTSQLSLAQPLTHSVAQAQPQSLTPTMPQLQLSPVGHMETQARPLPLTSTMFQFVSPSGAHTETQAAPLLLTLTMPQHQPQPQVHVETQAQSKPLSPMMTHFQPPPQAHMEAQTRLQPFAPTMTQCQSPSQAHMQTQAQP